MIPGAGGAAAVGALLILLAILLGVGLLAWWAWRLWNARRGTPRPPLHAWQWIAAIVMSVLPIFTALMWVEWMISDHLRERQQVQQDRLRFFTLPQAVRWGDVVLPAGSHVQRELLDDLQPAKGDASDLRTMTDIRFMQATALGDMSINAMGSNGNWLLLELARPHRFAQESCPAGYTAQFKALKERARLQEVPFSVYEALPLRMADWQFDSCFNARAIMVRYWKASELVFAQPPDYGLD